MREAYVKALAEEAKNNENIFGIVADIGTFTYDDFKEACSERFLNVGIAECNMIGMAAGMALEGKIPFVYSITPFVTARALEPIRVDVCYQNLNVKIVGCGSGFSYSTLGCTHHATDDIAIMRGLPNLVILSPADPREAKNCVKAAIKHKGPVYIRVGRSGEPVFTPENHDFKIGRAYVLREGVDLTIIGTGSIIYYALQAAEKLKNEKGLNIEIVNVPTIKPIDSKTIIETAKKTGKIITLEEHSIIGGLGSAVAEVLTQNQIAVPFKRLGLNDKFCEEYGEHIDLARYSKIAEPCIFNAVKEFYGEEPVRRKECGNCNKC